MDSGNNKLATDALSGKTHISASPFKPCTHQLATETTGRKNHFYKDVKMLCEMVSHELEFFLKKSFEVYNYSGPEIKDPAFQPRGLQESC